MYEYRERRCNSCPQEETMSQICPVRSQMRGLSPISCQCRYVKNYIDKGGYKYTVISWNDCEHFAVFSLAPGAELWRKYGPVQLCSSRDGAQAKLNQQARFLMWRELDPFEHPLGDCLNVEYR